MRIKAWTQIHPRAVKDDLWYSAWVDWKGGERHNSVYYPYQAGKVWLEAFATEQQALKGNAGANCAFKGCDLKGKHKAIYLNVVNDYSGSSLEEAARIMYKALDHYCYATSYQTFPTSECKNIRSLHPEIPAWKAHTTDMIPGYKEGAYKCTVLEDLGDRARAARWEVENLLGWKWARPLIDEIHGEDWLGEEEEE